MTDRQVVKVRKHREWLNVMTVACIEAMTDEQVTAEFGTWEDFLKKLVTPSLKQDILVEVQNSVRQVVDLVRSGIEFDKAVRQVKPNTWIGMVSWVEVKRQAREMLAE